MLLEPLTDTLARVHQRIKSFESEFTNNESQTRLSLVDPVLKVLGWDPQDPSLVKVEYPVRQRNRRHTKVDYALLDSNDEPIAFVEAKRLGTDLGRAHHQLFEYGAGESVPYAIATNGANWAVYKQEQTGTDFSSKQLLAVSITNQPSTLAAIKLLSLWRELLTSQSSIDLIAPALDTLKAHPLESEAANAETAPVSGEERTEQECGTREGFLQAGWHSLEDVEARQLTPKHVRFADGSIDNVETWKECYCAIVLKLDSEGHFQPNNISENLQQLMNPIQTLNHGLPLSNGFEVTTHLSPRDCIKRAKRFLMACGYDPANVYVK